MNIFLKILLLFFLFFSSPGTALAGELTGDISIEGRGFLNPPLYSGQRDHSGSVAIAPEYYHEFDPSLSMVIAPFFRFDSSDYERTHADLREAFLLKVFERFEVLLGAKKVFWGVTESAHIVDIINQTDLIEGPDGEAKLGQPMLTVSMPTNLGTIDLFLMPFFRERTFPGRKGRLRGWPRIDTEHPIYEDSAEEFHPDLAVRYSHFLGELELALSHFWGTSREPTLIASTDKDSNPVLLPYYEIINQTGVEAQYIVGELLLKFEAMHRSGQGQNFFQTATGFEYTFTGLLGTKADVGVLAEHLYDDRMDGAATPLQNDAMAGLRITLNDLKSTEALVGVVQDLENNIQSIFVESSRRIGERVRVTLEARLQEIGADERFSATRDDDYVELEIAWFF